MKIGVLRKTNATEVGSICTMETFMEKVKRETKGKYISQLRERLPSLQGSENRFIHLDKIPRIYPVAEFRRTKDGSWKFKQYNGIVLVEVNHLSGNRRFICVEVTAPIDTNVSVNYSQLYAQAFHAVMHGERYWLDDTEEALLKESNEEFRQVSPLEHLLQSCFSVASPEAGDGEWLMTMEVFNLLQANTREKLPIGKLNHLGRLLKKWNVPNKRTEKGSLYYLKKH